MKHTPRIISDPDDDADPSRLFTEIAPVGVLSVNSAGLISSANEEIERMFGYARHELIGQPVELLIPPRLRVRHAGLRNDYVAMPRKRPMGSHADLVGLRKDGTEFPVVIGLNYVRAENGLICMATL